MLFAEVVKECESAGGAGSKKVIQQALSKLDADGRKLMRYAMDPYTTFGVKKFDRPTSYAATDPHDISFLFLKLDSLASRELSGNAARDAVTELLSQFTEETASYIERVIDKDPKAGFSADTFNKVWPNDPIPCFDQQLAEKCETEEEFEARVTFPCYASVKYDGNRCFAFVREGQPVEYRARGGKLSEHLNGIFDAELQAMRSSYGHDFVLDGEVLATSFTETQNAKKSGNDSAKKNLVFRAFFIMPVSDWIAQKTTITNGQAMATLATLLADTKRVLLADGKQVNDYREMMTYCNEVIDDETRTQAEREGLILKNLDAVYEWGRSYAWVKVKRFYDVDARIVGFYPGRPKSRLENTVGGVNCVAFLESGERVEFNVGSGFSDEDREDMKNNPEKWLAGTHVIKYQEISKAQGKAYRSLRFCTYERTRDDKIVEI